MLIKNPCTRDCPDRAAECKKTCEAWIEYETIKKADYAKRQAKYEENMAYQEVIENAVTRMRRGKRRG